jgi:hypothetical protein
MEKMIEDRHIIKELKKSIPGARVIGQEFSIAKIKMFIFDSSKEDCFKVERRIEDGHDVIYTYFRNHKTCFVPQGLSLEQIVIKIQDSLSELVEEEKKELEERVSSGLRVLKGHKTSSEDIYLSTLKQKNFRTVEDFNTYLATIGDKLKNYEIASAVLSEIEGVYHQFKIFKKFAEQKDVNPDIKKRALQTLYRLSQWEKNSLYTIFKIAKKLEIEDPKYEKTNADHVTAKSPCYYGVKKVNRISYDRIGIHHSGEIYKKFPHLKEVKVVVLDNPYLSPGVLNSYINYNINVEEFRIRPRSIDLLSAIVPLTKISKVLIYTQHPGVKSFYKEKGFSVISDEKMYY